MPPETNISDHTTVSLALVITLVGAGVIVAGWLFWATWWASKITQRVMDIFDMLKDGKETFKKHDQRLNRIENSILKLKIKVFGHTRTDDLDETERSEP